MCIAGAVMYAAIFGTVTTTVQQLDRLRSGLTDELQTIGTFCKLYGIPLQSESKLISYRQHQWDATRGVDMRKVFVDLPPELVIEIKMCLYKDAILNISFFKDCSLKFVRGIVP